MTLFFISALIGLCFLLRSEALSLRMSTRVVSPPKTNLLNYVDGQIEDIYVCPKSLSPLKHVYRCFGLLEEEYLVSDQDKDLKYNVLPYKYTDLTIKTEVERPVWTLSVRERVGQNLFQTKLLPAIYERGYRQNFQTIGFPGIDKEFAEASEFFLAGSGAANGTLVDLSCGSGFMTRKFVVSKKFPRVIGADLSPTMLEESRRRFEEEGVPVPELIRCDSSRLPFATGSIDAIHAGAAMHCWPRLDESLAEIYRVLKPGGLAYLSTFFMTNPLDRVPMLSSKGRTGSSARLYFSSEEEIKEYITKAGFMGEGGATVVRKEGRGCAIIKCQKAPVATGDDMLGQLFAGKDTGSAVTNNEEGTNSGSSPNEGSPYTVM